MTRLDDILAAQAQSGAFVSSVRLPDRTCTDENGFVTALVLQALADHPTTPSLANARRKGLDFLERCAAAAPPGTFRFYPPQGQPEWMPLALDADIDDTALFSVALFDAGRLDGQRLRETAEILHQRFRVVWPSGAARPWHRAGSYYTWLNDWHRPNDIDLCANVNLSVLLHRTGQGERFGLKDIVAATQAGLDWAGNFSERARLLSPFYPDPVELAYAIARAVAQGVEALRPCLERLRDRPWAARDGTQDERPVCGSADGRILWRAPALQMARRLHASTPSTGSMRDLKFSSS